MQGGEETCVVRDKVIIADMTDEEMSGSYFLIRSRHVPMKEGFGSKQ
jgi:hypothetical protein